MPVFRPRTFLKCQTISSAGLSYHVVDLMNPLIYFNTVPMHTDA